MRPRYVIDTNVLIAASAVDAASAAASFATPEDPELRAAVWKWLSDFQESDSRLVLDRDQKIFEEYENNLTHNDFGIQVIIHKWSTAAVDDVDLDFDRDGHAILLEPLNAVVHDRSDRKIVAAAINGSVLYGESVIANASDSDWFQWKAGLTEAGIEVEHILEAWCHAKFLEKSTP